MSGPAPFSFGELLDLLRGRQVADAPCPLCSPQRKAINRWKPVLRLWQVDEHLISYHCVHCGASGCAWQDGEPRQIDPGKLVEAKEEREALHANTVAVQRKKARSIYARRRHIQGTLGECYFRDFRRITCKLPETIGYLPGDGRYPPAIVMPFGLTSEPKPGVLSIQPEAVVAVHLTRLGSDGNKLGDQAKIMIGTGAQGFPIVVAPPNDLLGLVITEGIEDALSARQATGLGAWAAGSKDRLVALASAIPDWIDCVTVRPDDDADVGGRRRAVQLVQAICRRMVLGPRGKLRPMYAELNEDGGI